MFRLAAGGVGGEPQIKMRGNFWVLPRASKARAGEAQTASFVRILRILSEIHSNFVQYTPQIDTSSFERVAPRGRVAADELLK